MTMPRIYLGCNQMQKMLRCYRQYIVFNEEADIFPSFCDDHVPLGFEFCFLCFRPAGYLGFSSPFAFSVRQSGVSSVERWKLAQA